MFAFNGKFVGHGTALYYVSKIKHDAKFQFTISNYNFIKNGISGKSVVYISSLNNKTNKANDFSHF